MTDDDEVKQKGAEKRLRLLCSKTLFSQCAEKEAQMFKLCMRSSGWLELTGGVDTAHMRSSLKVPSSPLTTLNSLATASTSMGP